jgi:hypothetical protein
LLKIASGTPAKSDRAEVNRRQATPGRATDHRLPEVLGQKPVTTANAFLRNEPRPAPVFLFWNELG